VSNPISQSDIDALTQKLTDNTTLVRQGDRELRNGTVDDIQKRRQMAQDIVDAQNGTIRTRQYLFATGKGL
jgi:hypothetical protein